MRVRFSFLAGLVACALLRGFTLEDCFDGLTNVTGSRRQAAFANPVRLPFDACLRGLLLLGVSASSLEDSIARKASPPFRILGLEEAQGTDQLTPSGQFADR
jgi:hypothetical protein